MELIFIRNPYEFYRRHKVIRTKEAILNLIKGFPGISFTEIQKTTRFSSGNLSNMLRELGSNIIIVRDQTRRHKKSNNSKNIRTMYFHKDMIDDIESLTE